MSCRTSTINSNIRQLPTPLKVLFRPQGLKQTCYRTGNCQPVNSGVSALSLRRTCLLPTNVSRSTSCNHGMSVATWHSSCFLIGCCRRTHSAARCRAQSPTAEGSKEALPLARRGQIRSFSNTGFLYTRSSLGILLLERETSHGLRYSVKTNR